MYLKVQIPGERRAANEGKELNNDKGKGRRMVPSCAHSRVDLPQILDPVPVLCREPGRAHLSRQVGRCAHLEEIRHRRGLDVASLAAVHK